MKYCPSEIRIFPDDATSAVCLAAHGGHLDVVRVLVELGANIARALCYAAARGYCGVVSYLLDESPLTTKDDFGTCAFHLAAKFGHLDVLRLMAKKKKGLDVNSECNGKSALEIACENGHLSVVTWLVSKMRVKIPIYDYGLLYVAAKNQHFKVVDFLVNHGATLPPMDHEMWKMQGFKDCVFKNIQNRESRLLCLAMCSALAHMPSVIFPIIAGYAAEISVDLEQCFVRE
jgi:ankyrin repeat protein